MRQIFSVVETTSGPPSFALIEIEDLKDEIGITGTSEDEKLVVLIERVSKSFGEYCDRIFPLIDVIEIFEFDPVECFQSRQPLILRQYPVVEIASITVDGETLTDDQYEYDADKGMIWRIGSAWRGRVEINYSGGYDLPDDAPAALQSALIEAVRQRRSFASADPTIRSSTHGDTSLTYNSEPVASAFGFSRIIVDALEPFRRKSF